MEQQVSHRRGSAWARGAEFEFEFGRYAPNLKEKHTHGMRLFFRRSGKMMMTVNQGVTGSSPVGGANKLSTLFINVGSFCFAKNPSVTDKLQ